jgi:hypothetical protein
MYVQRQLGHADIGTTERYYGHLERHVLAAGAVATQQAILRASAAALQKRLLPLRRPRRSFGRPAPAVGAAPRGWAIWTVWMICTVGSAGSPGSGRPRRPSLVQPARNVLGHKPQRAILATDPHRRDPPARGRLVDPGSRHRE